MGQNEQWLYRQQDLILGPVGPDLLVQKLYAGELFPNDEVQLMGTGKFVRLADVTQFKVHVAKAQAKARVEAHASSNAAQNRKRLLRNIALGAGVVTLLAGGLALVGNYLAVHSPTGKSVEELAWGDITIDAPTITAAKRGGGDELVDYQTGTVKKPVPRPLSPAGNNGAAPAMPSASVAAKTTKASDDPDGLEMGQVDTNAINSVVSRNKPSLIPCIKAVAKPGLVAKIPIEFTVSEGGKVSKVWVDNADFKGTGLEECLLRELSKWPFSSGSSGASVNLLFNIGKKS
jgi:hypothetical protein